MATQFRAESTGEWAFTRWFSGTATGSRGTCLDFGARAEAAFEAFEAARSGEAFWGDTGERFTAAEMESFQGEFTFGEFGGSFESGSQDEFRFCGF